MKVFAVSHIKKELNELKIMLGELCPDAEVLCFDNALSSLAEAREANAPDIAFLEIDTPEISGLVLGTYLKEINPYVNIILLASDKAYAYDAIKIHASGYLLKPVSGKDIKHELKDLRYQGSSATKSKVYVQTFGDFEIFVDGEPVNFKYSRTKEVVAVLVNNRGAQTTNGEIIASCPGHRHPPITKL